MQLVCKHTQFSQLINPSREGYAMARGGFM
jgi:hypothetical protein